MAGAAAKQITVRRNSRRDGAGEGEGAVDDEGGGDKSEGDGVGIDVGEDGGATGGVGDDNKGGVVDGGGVVGVDGVGGDGGEGETSRRSAIFRFASQFNGDPPCPELAPLGATRRWHPHHRQGEQ